MTETGRILLKTVVRVTRLRAERRLIVDSGKRFLSSHKHPDRLCGALILPFNYIQVLQRPKPGQDQHRYWYPD